MTARVDIRFGSLAAPPEIRRRLLGTLAPDELERAKRFHFARDRDRYVVGRGMLRALLAEYIGADPATLCFDYSPYGKPRLHDHGDVSFNVSHSADCVVFAFTRGAAVGVDVEVLDSNPSDELVARQFFSTKEVDAFLALPEQTRPRAFLTCWTRKEAYIKARGEGLSLPLQDFDVTLIPGGHARLLRTAWDPAEPSGWLLFDLSRHCADCVAALAVHARRADLSVAEVTLSAAGVNTCAQERSDVATQA